MPRKNKRSNRKRNSNRVSREINPTRLSYNGPLKLASANRQNQVMTTQLHGNLKMVSSAAGLLNGVLSLRNPSTSAGWANLVAVWDEFRVLSVVFEFQPFDRYNQTINAAVPPLLTFIDRDTSTVPATTTVAQSYGSCMMHDAGSSWRRSYRMDSSEEAGFVNTTVPTNVKNGSLGYIGIDTTANNLVYGYIFWTYLIQFRGLIT